MPSNRLTNALLGIIAIALCMLAARPYAHPDAVRADEQAAAQNADPIYVEPGVYMLRMPEGGQVLGKVAVNLRTGNVWGFPTGTTDPYPSSPIDNKPQTSRGIALGRFFIGDAR